MGTKEPRNIWNRFFADERCDVTLSLSLFFLFASPILRRFNFHSRKCFTFQYFSYLPSAISTTCNCWLSVNPDLQIPCFLVPTLNTARCSNYLASMLFLRLNCTSTRYRTSYQTRPRSNADRIFPL